MKKEEWKRAVGGDLCSASASLVLKIVPQHIQFDENSPEMAPLKLGRWSRCR